jgi:hypothetical protein
VPPTACREAGLPVRGGKWAGLPRGAVMFTFGATRRDDGGTGARFAVWGGAAVAAGVACSRQPQQPQGQLHELGAGEEGRPSWGSLPD